MVSDTQDVADATLRLQFKTWVGKVVGDVWPYLAQQGAEHLALAPIALAGVGVLTGRRQLRF